MITRTQAVRAGYREEFHEEGHPAPGRHVRNFTWRASGRCKTWARSAYAFKLPIKYGYNGPSTYITEETAGQYHLASECPFKVA